MSRSTLASIRPPDAHPVVTTPIWFCIAYATSGGRRLVRQQIRVSVSYWYNLPKDLNNTAAYHIFPLARDAWRPTVPQMIGNKMGDDAFYDRFFPRYRREIDFWAS